MREEEGQGKCEARQRGTPTGRLPRRDAPQTPRVPWRVCQPGPCAPLARPPGERCSQLSHGKGGKELPAHLPVGERSAPRALDPQQCTQNVKPRTLRPGLSSKARRGGRSQILFMSAQPGWWQQPKRRPHTPQVRARAVLEDGTPSRAGEYHRGHPRLVFNTVNRSPV